MIAAARRDRLVRDKLDLQPGQRVLDIGCAGGDALVFLPGDIDYVGVDASQAYIDAAQSRFANRGHFHRVKIGVGQAPELGAFDRVLVDGVLHHVDDPTALQLLSFAASALTADGQLVAIDPCFAAGQRWPTRRLLEADRGEHVRTEASYTELACNVFDTVLAERHGNLLRVPYTHLLMVCRNPRARSHATSLHPPATP